MSDDEVSRLPAWYIASLSARIGGGGGSGAPGAVWRTGSSAPSNALGSNGDYYLRSGTGDVYLKSAGSYSIVANIRGAAGPTGPQGTAGATGGQGVKGDTGAQGAKGDTGLTGSQGVQGATGNTGPQGPAGTANVGTAVLDFGATPAESASVVVTGQTGILAGSHVRAFFMRESTADNSIDEHEEAAALCPLSCGTIVPGTGFTICASPIAMLGVGTFNIRWNWL